MNTEPLISVIVPVYNVEQYISKCVDSIQKQTYRNVEIILVDDGSTDRSRAVCEKKAETDGRIHVIHQKNGGPSNARNTGIDYADGDYYLFIDGDDYIAPEMVEKLYGRIKTDSSDLAMCGIARVDENGVPFEEDALQDALVTGFQALERSYGYKGWLFCSFIVNKLYHKHLFESIRFPEGKFHEDEATVYRLLDQCNQISVVSAVLYYYVNRENSTMNAEYSVRRLDGVEAIYQRYRYYREKGGKYLDFLIPDGKMFAVLFYDSKQLFTPSTYEEKKRVAEIDRMAKEICLDNFSKWSLPRKIKLLSPKTYIRLGRIKKTMELFFQRINKN